MLGDDVTDSEAPGLAARTLDATVAFAWLGCAIATMIIGFVALTQVSSYFVGILLICSGTAALAAGSLFGPDPVELEMEAAARGEELVVPPEPLLVRTRRGFEKAAVALAALTLGAVGLVSLSWWAVLPLVGVAIMSVISAIAAG